jgi:hypothetical protein
VAYCRSLISQYSLNETEKTHKNFSYDKRPGRNSNSQKVYIFVHKIASWYSAKVVPTVFKDISMLQSVGNAFLTTA